ncbi:SusC/RagA family TonB-linked outer membrane protein [Bacteroidia bacterium]|nr:SusC/RagA family TonB-linked outer membrane protein [Bacteroidia bacterium]
MGLLLSMAPIYAQQALQTISGTVSSKGETLIGASVVEKSTSNGTVTDVDGQFNLKVKPNTQLVVSYIGYKTKTVNVGKQSVVNIELEEDANVLDEVVAIGYGVQQKKLVTGATLQVKGDDITKLNTVSALGALQSQAPGVNIVKSSGKPGDHFKVTIRGLGTIQNSKPLYIIDGVPAGDTDDAINNLNPADIEAIDVLKDAASAAIYGSRAANGVVLVTTKQGKAGKTSIQYDGYLGWQNVYKKITPLNAQQYMDIYNEASGVDPADPIRYDKFYRIMEAQDKAGFDAGTWNGTNWLDEMINSNAPVTNHALNITGGSETSVFSIGMAYTSQSPLIGVSNDEIDPKYDRYNVRINTEHNLIKYKDFTVLQFGQTLSAVYKNSKAITMATQHSNWNDIRNALSANPLYRVNGTDNRFANSRWNILENNPIASMYYNSFSQGHNYALRGSFYFVLQPIKGLKYRTSFGYNYSGWDSRSWKPVYDDLSFSGAHDYSEIQQSSDQGLDWNIDNTLSYDFYLWKNHHFNAMLGASAERTGLGMSTSARSVNSKFDDFEHAYISNGATSGTIDQRVGVGGSPWSWRGALASFFGRINYDYKGTYMATLTMRRDGSSNFARGYRWGNFPSVSAGWTVSNESFMASAAESWLDFLKIRASWGQNGNQSIPTFRYNANISRTGGLNGYAFGPDKSVTSYMSTIANVPNPAITWETSEQLDFGFDSWMLKNRLGVNVDFYQKSTIDWLVQPPVLGTNGTGAPYINGGKVRNTGVELFLTWQNQDAANDFKYSITANMAYNKNQVIDIPNEEKRFTGGANALGEQTDAIFMAAVGYPIGYFYGYKADGIIQTYEEAVEYDRTHKIYDNNQLLVSQPGDIKYVDVYEDGVIDSKDKTIIGDPNPDVSFGTSVTLSWKGFDFSVTGSGVAGNQIAKSYRSYATQSTSNYTTEILDRWTEENHSNRFPRLGSGSEKRNWLKISDQIFIEDGDYFRINNVTLGYDFKQLFRKSLLFSQIRLYAQVQNLLTFTKYTGMDPEVGAAYNGDGGDTAWGKGIDIGFYPSARTYLVGLSVKF